MRRNTQHKRNLKYEKMSDNELSDRYNFLRSNSNNYFKKKEFSQLITFLINNNKGELIC